MQRTLYLLALVAVAAVMSACDNAATTPTTPSSAAPQTYTATLLPSDEVPPVFTQRGISVPVDQANSTNIHTAANPNGVARGPLVRNQERP